MKFGKRLSAERKKHQLTSKTLAQACGVSRSYITLIETGQRLPGVHMLRKLADVLNLQRAMVLNWYIEDVREKTQKALES